LPRQSRKRSYFFLAGPRGEVFAAGLALALALAIGGLAAGFLAAGFLAAGFFVAEALTVAALVAVALGEEALAVVFTVALTGALVAEAVALGFVVAAVLLAFTARAGLAFTFDTLVAISKFLFLKSGERIPADGSFLSELVDSENIIFLTNRG